MVEGGLAQKTGGDLFLIKSNMVSIVANAQLASEMGQGLPLRPRRQHVRCTPDSRRLLALPKSAASGHKRSFTPPPSNPSVAVASFPVATVDADRYWPVDG